MVILMLLLSVLSVVLGYRIGDRVETSTIGALVVLAACLALAGSPAMRESLFEGARGFGRWITSRMFRRFLPTES